MSKKVLIAKTDEEINKFNDFALKNRFGSIHQTSFWGNFQSHLSDRDKYQILMVLDEEKCISSGALLIRNKLPFGFCWHYSPRGPLVDYCNNEKHEDFKLLAEYVKKHAKKEKSVFWRIDPPLVINSKKHNIEKNGCNSGYLNNFLKKEGFCFAHANYQPCDTLKIDLSKPDEQILAEMKPKGRYNIKLAQKRGVNIRLSDGNTEDLNAFYNLLKSTTERDGFQGHDKKYYQEMLKTLGKNKSALMLAEYDSKIIAAVILTFFGKEAIYYFGASSNEYRNVMASYLLQFEAIKEAKKRNCAYYDFLGIAPDNNRKHSLTKVSDFKLKFGGEKISYLPAMEIIYKPLIFFIIILAKKILVLKKNFVKAFKKYSSD